MNLDAGVYIAVFYMPRERTIQIGRLGRFRFQQGVYFYAGSAQRSLSARLEHHNRKNKILHWHIDYLSVRSKMLGARTLSSFGAVGAGPGQTPNRPPRSSRTPPNEMQKWHLMATAVPFFSPSETERPDREQAGTIRLRPRKRSCR